MEGKPFARVKYLEGHSKLGRRKIPVTLVAYPTCLTLQHTNDHEDLISIPWPNLSVLRTDWSRKTPFEGEVSIWVSMIPILGETRYSDWKKNGLRVTYWDEEVQREMKIFLDTGTLRRADKIKDAILSYRDDYYRFMGRHAGPQRRK